MKIEKYESGPMQYKIRGVESDMGEDTSMDLIITQGGDAVITLKDGKGKRIEITFNTYQGGTKTPGLATRFKFLADYLYMSSKDPQFATKLMAENLNRSEGEKL